MHGVRFPFAKYGGCCDYVKLGPVEKWRDDKGDWVDKRKDMIPVALELSTRHENHTIPVTRELSTEKWDTQVVVGQKKVKEAPKEKEKR